MANINKIEVENMIKSLDPKWTQKGKDYNIHCCICGDSAKNQRKKRLWFYYIDDIDSYSVHCYNCGANMSLKFFVQHYAPDWYGAIFPKFFNVFNKKSPDEIHKRNITKTKQELKKEYKIRFHKFVNENKNMKLEKLPKVCSDYLLNRGCDPDFVKKCVWCSSGYFENRIVFPFFDDENKLYYLLGRSIREDDPVKYKNISSYKALYGVFSVDDTIPFYVLEGMFDSMFVPNSVAICGKSESTILDPDQLIFGMYKRDNLRFIQDNDATGRKVAKKLVAVGVPVFKWKEFLSVNKLPRSCKDVSDVQKHIDFKISGFQSFFTKEKNSLFMV